MRERATGSRDGTDASSALTGAAHGAVPRRGAGRPTRFLLLRRARTALVRLLELSLVVGFSALTLDVSWGVASRYLLAAQSPWTEELAIYLLVWVSLLGASLAYAEGAHLGVDYLVGKLHPSARRLVQVAAELLVMAFSVVVLLYGGTELVTRTLGTGQVSPALGVAMGYVYLAVPISGVFFLLFSLENLIDPYEPPCSPKS